MARISHAKDEVVEGKAKQGGRLEGLQERVRVTTESENASESAPVLRFSRAFPAQDSTTLPPSSNMDHLLDLVNIRPRLTIPRTPSDSCETSESEQVAGLRPWDQGSARMVSTINHKLAQLDYSMLESEIIVVHLKEFKDCGSLPKDTINKWNRRLPS